MADLTNREIAAIFSTVADMLELKGENIHRVLAYRRAAETLASLARDIQAVYKENALTDLPHIGPTLAENIAELIEPGELEIYNRLKTEVPPEAVADRAGPGRGRT